MVTRFPRLIIVAGLPGVGKTSLARGLSCRLGIPLLEKDTVKESLADILSTPWSEDWSAELGAASEETLFRLAALEIQLGHDVIVETPMIYARSWERLWHNVDRQRVEPRMIACHCSEETLRARIDNRKQERHGIHTFRGQDPGRILSHRAEFEEQVRRQDIPCLFLNTENPQEEILAECEAFLSVSLYQ
ncbi:MAG: ATP-binding protein [bacterium]